jgi:hypothetical protein
MFLRTVLGGLAALALVSAAHAEVTDVSDAGFTITQTVTVDVPPERAFQAMLHPGDWWDSSHTYSRDAHNVTVNLERQCLCEALPNGGWTRHLDLITYIPGREVVFSGGMGPMARSGATGHMSWSVEARDGHTVITWRYQIGGYFAPGGMRGFAPAVDGMLGHTIGRLKTYLDTGRPE